MPSIRLVSLVFIVSSLTATMVAAELAAKLGTEEPDGPSNGVERSSEQILREAHELHIGSRTKARTILEEGRRLATEAMERGNPEAARRVRFDALRRAAATRKAARADLHQSVRETHNAVRAERSARRGPVR